MRTTITLDDRLLATLKKRASDTGTTVSKVIEQAVRLSLHAGPRRGRKHRFDLVTFGRGGRFTTRNIDKISALLEQEDLVRFRPRR